MSVPSPPAAPLPRSAFRSIDDIREEVERRHPERKALSPIKAMMVELDQRLKTSFERVRDMDLLDGNSLFGKGRPIMVFTAGCVLGLGLVPAALFASGVSDIESAFDSALVAIFVISSMSTVDNDARRVVLPPLLFAALQLQKAIYMYGNAVRGQWSDFGFDLYVIVLLNPAVYGGFTVVAKRLCDELVRHPVSVRELMSASMRETAVASAFIGCLCVELAGYVVAGDDGDDADGVDGAGGGGGGGVDAFNLRISSTAAQVQILVTTVLWLLVFRPSKISVTDAFRLDVPRFEMMCVYLLLASWVIVIYMLGGRLIAGARGGGVFFALFLLCNLCWAALIVHGCVALDYIMEQTINFLEADLTHGVSGERGEQRANLMLAGQEMLLI